jgi:hypothetical protein
MPRTSKPAVAAQRGESSTCQAWRNSLIAAAKTQVDAKLDSKVAPVNQDERAPWSPVRRPVTGLADWPWLTGTCYVLTRSQSSNNRGQTSEPRGSLATHSQLHGTCVQEAHRHCQVSALLANALATPFASALEGGSGGPWAADDGGYYNTRTRQSSAVLSLDWLGLAAGGGRS